MVFWRLGDLMKLEGGSLLCSCGEMKPSNAFIMLLFGGARKP